MLAASHAVDLLAVEETMTIAKAHCFDECLRLLQMTATELLQSGHETPAEAVAWTIRRWDKDFEKVRAAFRRKYPE